MIGRMVSGVLIGLGILGDGMCYGGSDPDVKVTSEVIIPTMAILPFECRLTGSSAEGMGSSMADALAATLSETGNYNLVERGEINKTMEELKLSASGLVSQDSQLKVGHMVGAKIIITGSIFKSAEKSHVVAKIIGVETSQVVACSVSGAVVPIDLLPELKIKIDKALVVNLCRLMPKPVDGVAVVEKLRRQIGKVDGTKIYVNIGERTMVNIDPAAETEMKKILLALGFSVVESSSDADYRLLGEGLAENSGNFKGFASAMARLELNLYDKHNHLLATDRQVETIAGSASNIAAKNALAQAALVLASRLLPKIKSDNNIQQKL